MVSLNVYFVVVLYWLKYDLSYIFCDYIIKNIFVDIVGKIFLNVKIWLFMLKWGMLMFWNIKYVKLVKLNWLKKISINLNNLWKNVFWLKLKIMESLFMFVVIVMKYLINNRVWYVIFEINMYY